MTIDISESTDFLEHMKKSMSSYLEEMKASGKPGIAAESAACALAFLLSKVLEINFNKDRGQGARLAKATLEILCERLCRSGLISQGVVAAVESENISRLAAAEVAGQA